MKVIAQHRRDEQRSTFLAGHSLDVLKTLPSVTVECCITSPPYWGLRDYQTEPQVWGGDENCGHCWLRTGPLVATGKHRAIEKVNGANIKTATKWPSGHSFCTLCGAWFGSLGLEPTPELYVEHLVIVFREVMRVLKPDGTLWLVIGDCYAGSWGTGKRAEAARRIGRLQRPEFQRTIERDGLLGGASAQPLKPKDLVGIPWQVAFALRAEGWYLRTDIVWHKPNPMPENVRDRPTRAHETIFLFAKQPRYSYDHKAIAEPLAASSVKRISQRSFDRQTGGPKDYRRQVAGSASHRSSRRAIVNLKGRAMPSHWAPPQIPAAPDQTTSALSYRRNKRSVWTISTHAYAGKHFATFPPELIRPCVRAGCPTGGTVLDPFMGAGTTGLVARQEGRKFIGIELNESYLDLARERIGQ